MDRKVAEQILEAYGRPSFKVGNNILSFSRQDLQCVEHIEKMTDDTLIESFKSLVFINDIYGQVSLNDLQRIDLIELEISERGIGDGLKEWYEKSMKEFEEGEAEFQSICEDTMWDAFNEEALDLPF